MNLRNFLRDISGLDDPPHKIALGMALGIFVGFLPIMGIQMAVVLPFALLFRANKACAIAGVWITNPVTVIPIYYLNYRVGLLFLDYQHMTWAMFEDLFAAVTMHKFLRLGEAILVPLVGGGFVLAVVFSIPTYFVTRSLVIRARERQAVRRQRKQAQQAGPE